MPAGPSALLLWTPGQLQVTASDQKGRCSNPCSWLQNAAVWEEERLSGGRGPGLFRAQPPLIHPVTTLAGRSLTTAGPTALGVCRGGVHARPRSLTASNDVLFPPGFLPGIYHCLKSFKYLFIFCKCSSSSSSSSILPTSCYVASNV